MEPKWLPIADTFSLEDEDPCTVWGGFPKRAWQQWRGCYCEGSAVGQTGQPWRREQRRSARKSSTLAFPHLTVDRTLAHENQPIPKKTLKSFFCYDEIEEKYLLWKIIPLRCTWSVLPSTAESLDNNSAVSFPWGWFREECVSGVCKSHVSSMCLWDVLLPNTAWYMASVLWPSSCFALEGLSLLYPTGQ